MTCFPSSAELPPPSQPVLRGSAVVAEDCARRPHAWTTGAGLTGRFSPRRMFRVRLPAASMRPAPRSSFAPRRRPPPLGARSESAASRRTRCRSRHEELPGSFCRASSRLPCQRASAPLRDLVASRRPRRPGRCRRRAAAVGVGRPGAQPATIGASSNSCPVRPLSLRVRAGPIDIRSRTSRPRPASRMGRGPPQLYTGPSVDLRGDRPPAFHPLILVRPRAHGRALRRLLPQPAAPVPVDIEVPKALPWPGPHRGERRTTSSPSP